MALGTNHIIASEVGNFIPELWSDEVVASYKANIVMANLVRKLNHRGKKGDTIRIPTPARADVSVKAAETQVTLIQHGTDNGLVVTIDRHVEYSRLIEDIVDIQALESLRRFYTDDAGYSIGRDVDLQLIYEAADVGFNNLVLDGAKIDSTSTRTLVLEGDGTTWDGAASTAIADGGIREFIKRLDDNDVPMAQRVMVIPTVAKKALLGTARFTEQAFVGEQGRGNSIRNGLVGDVYGMDVYVTTQLPIVEREDATADNVLGLVFQRDGLLLVEQAGVRSQTQYKQEYLADLFTADMLYGTAALRTESVLVFVQPI